MALKSVIRKGDTTTHGGTVLEGIDSFPVMGIPVACKGHMVLCPKCDNEVYPIIEGISSMPVHGSHPAVEGMKTACGAVLIASQSSFQLVQTSGSMPTNPDFDERVKLTDSNGNVMANALYTIKDESGNKTFGESDSYGYTDRVYTEAAENYEIYLGHDVEGA